MPLPQHSTFLSLDGLDGTGKSTQCQLLRDRLVQSGYPTTICADPGGTEIGLKIRELLLFGKQSSMGMRTEALLFMASRAELVMQQIQPILTRGEIVLCDRFLLANVVYQGHAGGLDVDELWRIGRFATGGVEPDLTVILDAPVNVARARRNRAADRMESRNDSYFQRVRDGFLFEAQRQPERVQVVDAVPPVPQVHEAIFDKVQAFLKTQKAAS